MFLLSDAWYTFLKWLTLVVIPAISTAYVGLAAVFGWPFADKVAKTSAIVCAFLGTILGISTAQYNKQQPPGEE